MTAGSKGPTSAFNPPADAKTGDIVIEKGARLSAPTTPEKVGGRITLIGANVRNSGTISTPDGQTILAAGLQVGFDAHSSADPSLRGLDVYVGQVAKPVPQTFDENGDIIIAPPVEITAGTVVNTGLIDAPRANVTFAGRTLQHTGVIASSTSTSLNGRVDLLASYDATANTRFDPTRPNLGPIFQNRTAGTIELGAESSIQILPELADPKTIVGTRLALPSQVNLQALSIHLATNAQIIAPNAAFTLSADNWVPVGNLTALRFTGGQVYLDPGATIDVSGSTNVTAPLTENILILQA